MFMAAANALTMSVHCPYCCAEIFVAKSLKYPGMSLGWSKKMFVDSCRRTGLIFLAKYRAKSWGIFFFLLPVLGLFF